jgi:hypothetical protein
MSESSDSEVFEFVPKGWFSDFGCVSELFN